MEMQDEARDKRIGYIMMGVTGVLTLLFCCGGALVTGIAGSGSESDGMLAAMWSSFPGCCACSGFLTAAIGMVALKGKPMAKIIAPIAVGFMGGIAGSLGMWIFFEVIFPSL